MNIFVCRQSYKDREDHSGVALTLSISCLIDDMSSSAQSGATPSAVPRWKAVLLSEAALRNHAVETTAAAFFLADVKKAIGGAPL